MINPPSIIFFFFFFNDTATTEIYTLSLHDALPIFVSETAKNLIGIFFMKNRVEGKAAALARRARPVSRVGRSEEHTSELQSPCNLVCRLLLEKKKKITIYKRCRAIIVTLISQCLTY